jgi:hypothetical protein
MTLLFFKKFFFNYRFDPVPFTGGYKNTVRSYYRHPKTTNERKQSCQKSTQQYIRSKRNFKNLINSYDDPYIADNKIRSWKRTKKIRQWV